MSPRGTKNDRTITLTDKALEIYDSWPHMEKSKRVSAAIEKHSRDTGTSIEQRLTELEQKVKAIEEEVDTWLKKK